MVIKIHTHQHTQRNTKNNLTFSKNFYKILRMYKAATPISLIMAPVELKETCPDDRSGKGPKGFMALPFFHTKRLRAKKFICVCWRKNV